MTDTSETELLIARRAFPEAQRLLAGEPTGDFSGTTTVGWHDVGVHPELGAFALADFGGPFDDEKLIGEVLRVTLDGRPPIYVYLVGRADLAWDLSLARRSYVALAELRVESLVVSIDVVT